MEKVKIFQIGFNKCGTQSLCDFFSQNEYKSVHWGEGKWDNHFKKNQSEGNPLCEGADDIVMWTDIGFIQRQFQTFAEQYPTSKFIYNIRPLDKWLDSRDRQYKKHPESFINAFGFVIESRLDRIDYWKSEWLYHKRVVNEYFIGEKSSRLLTFDIEKNTGFDIQKFIPELHFKNLNLPYRNKG
jgi:hypothetical protein